MSLELSWHNYKYYPYERELALREVETLLAPAAVHSNRDAVFIDAPISSANFNRLVYFAAASDKSGVVHKTQQSLLERVNGNGLNRQSTRYSVHGLHEYKGKFNPQMAKVLLNIFKATPGQRAFDPFSGSGTSLVECAHMGVTGKGADINPMAVFLANAKLTALGVPADTILISAKQSVGRVLKSSLAPEENDERNKYLLSWFSKDILSAIEGLRIELEQLDNDVKVVLLAIASNLLRDYSLQAPEDLRIRRRKTPLPSTPFLEAFETSTQQFCTRLKDAQSILGIIKTSSSALLADCRNLEPKISEELGRFDLALTSPPYATALPYIDTQRLSLVWLGLINPENILELESKLIGSREIRGQNKKELLLLLENNESNLPKEELEFCLKLQNALDEEDGFRRQVVPRLLYRYFSDMVASFKTVKSLMKPDSPYGLIVGGNHTILGGKRFDINTPNHLINIAKSVGWAHAETVELQTYQRYGLHVNNATKTEALIILKA